MRFALMIEPQQGLTYDEQLAVALRAEAAGFEALFRSDHYESFPGGSGRPTTDAWAVLAGLARDTTKIGLGALVSPVTYRTPGNLAKVVVNDRRDERRPGRGRARRGLARGGAPAPRLPVPGDRRAGRHARGDARDPPRPVGRARRLVVHRQALRDRGLAVPAQAERAAGPQRRPAADHRRWRGVAPVVPDRRQVRGRVQPLVGEPRGGGARSTRELDATIKAAGREPSSITHSAMVGVLMGRDGRRGEGPRGESAHGVRRVGGGRGLVRAAPRPLDPRHARPGARGASRGSRRPASNGSCSRTSCPATST